MSVSLGPFPFQPEGLLIKVIIEVRDDRMKAWRKSANTRRSRVSARLLISNAFWCAHGIALSFLLLPFFFLISDLIIDSNWRVVITFCIFFSFMHICSSLLSSDHPFFLFLFFSLRSGTKIMSFIHASENFFLHPSSKTVPVWGVIFWYRFMEKERLYQAQRVNYRNSVSR